MVLLNTWRIEGRRLVDLLAPGEVPLALTPTSLSPTEFPALTELERKATEDDGTAGSKFWRAAGAVGAVVGYVPSLGDKLLDKFDNDAVSGADDSIARSIGRRVDQAPSGDQRYLAVTDRRLLVLHGSANPRDPLTVIAELDRGTVRTAEVRSNVLSGSIGRLRITFADDSWLEFADTLNMGRQRAGDIRDALVEGRSSVEGEPGPPQP